MNKSLVFLIVLTALVVALAAPALAPVPAEASGPVCPAPGTGLWGALNMIADPYMEYTMLNHTAPKGNDGMNRAVDITACPP